MASTETWGLVRNDAISTPRSKTLTLSTEWVFFALLVLGLAWVPYWLGSNRMTPWGINALIFPSLAALYELSIIVRRVPHPVGIERIGIPAALFLGAAAWAFLQNATWMPLSWQHPIWQLASDVLDRPVQGSISVDRSLTDIALLRLVTAASVFWLALQLSRNSARARSIIWSVVAISAVYTVIGMFALHFMPNGRVFPEVSEHPSKYVTSTFANPNHYATFAGIGFISAAGLVLRLYRHELGQSGHLLRLKLAAFIHATGSKAVLPLALAATVLIGVLLSGSRGGIIATGIGFFALLILNMRRRRSASRSQVFLLITAALVVGAVFVGFSDAFLARVGERGFAEQGRLHLFLLTIVSTLKAPVLGFGHGTFAAAFPMFHDDSLGVWVLWDKAHNSYLETFHGLGLLFGGMLIASLVTLVWSCVKGATSRQRNATITAIAGSVSVLVGVHALADFSLQIQAVTLTYMAILGAGVGQCFEHSK